MYRCVYIDLYIISMYVQYILYIHDSCYVSSVCLSCLYHGSHRDLRYRTQCMHTKHGV